MLAPEYKLWRSSFVFLSPRFLCLCTSTLLGNILSNTLVFHVDEVTPRLWTADTSGCVAHPSGHKWYGESRYDIDRWNRRTRGKPVPLPLCTKQVPHVPSWTRTRASAVCDMTRPALIVTTKFFSEHNAWRGSECSWTNYAVILWTKFQIPVTRKRCSSEL